MTKELDFDAIKAAAESHRADMTRFLRAMISHPSESCEEGEVVACIKAEMESLGYDEVKVDGLGNVMGFMGEGDKIIAIDSHIDTVGIGNIENWDADPYEGYETDEIIYGRGGSDQEGGMASATYAAKMMKDMGLIPEGYKIMVVGTVQEEDCDGMCWQYIYNKDGIKPEFVISTEPTDGGIYRGHRGRMEIRVDVHGMFMICRHMRRQRHLQDGRHHRRRPRPQQQRLRRVDRHQGPRQDARPQVQPRAL